MHAGMLGQHAKTVHVCGARRTLVVPSTQDVLRTHILPALRYVRCMGPQTLSPLHSQGAIRVFARVRPLAPGEAHAAGDGSAPVVRVDAAAGAVEVASGRCPRVFIHAMRS